MDSIFPLRKSDPDHIPQERIRHQHFRGHDRFEHEEVSPCQGLFQAMEAATVNASSVLRVSFMLAAVRVMPTSTAG